MGNHDQSRPTSPPNTNPTLSEVQDEFCGTQTDLREFASNICEFESHSWCEDEAAAVAACGDLADASYPSFERAHEVLTSAENPPALENLREVAAGSQVCGFDAVDASCEFRVATFKHDPDQTLTMQELLALSRMLASPGPGVYPELNVGPDAREGFDSFMSVFDASAAAAELADSLGLDMADAEFGTATGPEFQAFHGECEGSHAVLHFPAEGLVFDFNTLTCFGEGPCEDGRQVQPTQKVHRQRNQNEAAYDASPVTRPMSHNIDQHPCAAPARKSRWSRVAVIVLGAGALLGCSAPPRTFDVCGAELTESELDNLLRTDLAATTVLANEAASKSNAVSDLALLTSNSGIDFRLFAARPTQVDGVYKMNDWDRDIRFRLFFAEDFGDSKAGDPIPHNVFSLSSYANNPSPVIEGDGVRIEYQPGPLFDLVAGEIEYGIKDGIPTFPSSVVLRTELIDLEVSADVNEDWAFEPGDQWQMNMSMMRTNLGALATGLDDGGYVLTIEGASYTPQDESVELEFAELELSALRPRGQDDQFEGEYRSWVESAGVRLYKLGFLSSQGGNESEYFCDEARTEPVSAET